MIKLPLPDFVDLDTLAGNYCKACGVSKHRRYIDRIAFILGSLYRRWTLQDSHGKGKKEKFFSLNAEVLKKAIGDDYPVYLDTLLSYGMLCTPENSKCRQESKFIPGVHSRKFGFTKDLRYVKKIKWHRIQDTIVSKAIANSLAVIEKREAEYAKDQHPHLYKHFSKRYLTLDIAEALRIHHQEWLKDLAAVKREETTIAKAINRRLRRNLIIRDYMEGSYYVSVDQTGYRFHSLLTRTPKVLRSALRYRGEKLAGADLKCSQPYLLNTYLFPSKKISTIDIEINHSIKKLIPEIEQEWRKLTKEQKKSHLQLPCLEETDESYSDLSNKREEVCVTDNVCVKDSIIMLRNLLETPVNTGVSGELYRKMTSGGYFYEVIQDLFFGKYKTSRGVDRFQTRRDTKAEVMKIFYCKRPRTEEPVFDFMRIFPLVGRVILLLKHSNYKNFPILLQRLESYLFLSLITKELSEEGITPIFTIHDSIVTLPEHIEKVKDKMQEVLTRVVGVAPEIDIDWEEWGWKQAEG